MKLTIQRRETFCASHRLYNPNLSKDENEKLYKKCSKIHGHNYVLIVNITGDVDKQTGMIIPFEDMKYCIGSVVDLFDHTYLNDFDFFKEKQTTVENFAFLIWDLLEEKFEGKVIIDKIELFETEKNSVCLTR